MFLLLLAEVVALQILSGAYASDFAGDFDEAAHFTTAAMVKSYISGGEYANPLGYAQDYYASFPKVAIGHWPPVFYTILAGWMLVFGATRASALALMAVFCAATCWIFWRIADRAVASGMAVAGALVLAAMPQMQLSVSAIMLDVPVTFFTVAAVWFWLKFVRAPGIWTGLLLCAACVGAVLTRASGWSLGFGLALSILMGRRFDLLRRPSSYAVGGTVLALSVPWYLAVSGLSTGAFMGTSFLEPDFLRLSAIRFGRTFVDNLGVILLAGGAMGAAVSLRHPQGERGMAGTTAISLVFAVIGLHLAVPAGAAPRYMLPALPFALLLTLVGAGWLLERFAEPQPAKALLIGGFCVAFLAGPFQFTQTLNTGVTGVTDRALAAIPVDRATPVLLVVAGNRGEGAVIADAAARYRPEQVVILRGTKLLVDQDWLGRDPVEKVSSIDELRALLDSLPVDAMLIEEDIPERQRRGFHALAVKEALSRRWVLRDSFPVVRDGAALPKGLALFVRAVSFYEDAATLDRNEFRSLIRP